MRTVSAILASVLLSAVAVTLFLAFRARNPRGVECPVILVHGYGNKGDVWLAKGYQDLQSPECLYIGNLETRGGEPTYEFCRQDSWKARYPWYTVNLTDRGFGPIPDSAGELATFIELVKRETGARDVALVGFSLGGVVCREYLTGPGYAGDVKCLVTVSSPHLGSEFSALHEFLELLREMSEGASSRWVREACRKTEEAVAAEVRRHGVNLRAPALEMLCPPEPGNYLHGLNRRVHPSDVRYACIATMKSLSTTSLDDILTDLKRLASTAAEFRKTTLFACLANASRVVAGKFGGMAGEGTESLAGDGFVSVESQDLRNVHFFKQHPEVAVEVRTVPSTHFNESFQRDLVELTIISMAKTSGERPASSRSK
jgi:pimeloyl-ACP methyl ester carboxylesterase